MGAADRAVAAGGAEHRAGRGLGRAGRRRGARDPGAWAAAPTRRASPIRPWPPPSSTRPSPTSPPTAPRCGSAGGSRRSIDGRPRRALGFTVGGEAIALGDDDAVILATPAWTTPGPAARPRRARRVPRHRQRPLQDRRRRRARRADRRRDRRDGAVGVRLRRPHLGHRQRRRRRGRHAARGAGARRSGPTSPRSTAWRGADCRPGRSSRSAAPPSPPRPSRSPGARRPAPAGATLRWPATGPIPACPPPSRARSARATRPPSSSWPLRRAHGRRSASTDELTAATSARRPRRGRGAAPPTRSLKLQRPDGHWVFELEADATIPAEYVLLRALSRRAGGPGAGAQDRRLPAPHPGRARRLAAVSRRRPRRSARR